VATYERTYDTLDAMVAAASLGWTEGRRHQGSDAELAGDSGFIGRRFTGWADAVAKLGEAWPEGLDEVQWMLFELRKVALPPVKCQKRRPRFSDDGDEVDQDRLRCGQEYWRSMRRESVAGPQTFCIVTDMSTSCKKDARDILWRGAVAIIIADLLEEQGHRVELWAACREVRAYKDRSNNFQAVCLKRADRPVDISTLTNAVSGWCYRTLFLQERASEPRSKMMSHAGFPTVLSADVPQVAQLAGNSRLLTVAGVFSREAALAFAAQTIESLNQ
jgi:hypothetical protein